MVHVGPVAGWDTRGLARERRHCEVALPKWTTWTLCMRSAEFSREAKIHLYEGRHLAIQSSRKPSVGHPEWSSLRTVSSLSS